jgi:hypothetical protein
MDALGARDRVPAEWEQVIARDPHERVLRRAGLIYEGKTEFSTRMRWSAESLIGFVYSTSFLNLDVVKGESSAFEDELRGRLLECCPDGVFEQDLTFAYDLGRRAR